MNKIKLILIFLAVILILFSGCEALKVFDEKLDNSSSSLSASSSSAAVSRSGIYVSVSGKDGSSGTFDHPLKTIQAGIDKTDITNNIVYVQQGIYNESLIITNSAIVVSGGWDYTYSYNNNYSIIDGTNRMTKLISISGTSDVLVDRFVLRNSKGPGLYINFVTNTKITNLVVSNNITPGYGAGGGIYITGGNSVSVHGLVSGNSSFAAGGIYILHSCGTTFTGNLDANSSFGTGGVRIDYSTNCAVNGIIRNNVASFTGGIYIFQSSNTTINAEVSSNAATNSGGAAGGVNLSSSTNVIINGNIISNYNNNCGGGMMIWNSSNIVITGCVSNNNGVGKGGGIFMTNTGNLPIDMRKVGGNLPDQTYPPIDF